MSEKSKNSSSYSKEWTHDRGLYNYENATQGKKNNSFLRTLCLMLTKSCIQNDDTNFLYEGIR